MRKQKHYYIIDRTEELLSGEIIAVMLDDNTQEEVTCLTGSIIGNIRDGAVVYKSLKGTYRVDEHETMLRLESLQTEFESLFTDE